MRLDGDAELGRHLNMTARDVEAARKSCYAKLRRFFASQGYRDVPETDEGLFFWMRFQPVQEIKP